jgi:hypothetical protein
MGAVHETETLAPAFSSKSLNLAASSLVRPPFTTLGAPASFIRRWSIMHRRPKHLQEDRQCKATGRQCFVQQCSGGDSWTTGRTLNKIFRLFQPQPCDRTNLLHHLHNVQNEFSVQRKSQLSRDLNLLLPKRFQLQLELRLFGGGGCSS